MIWTPFELREENTERKVWVNALFRVEEKQVRGGVTRLAIRRIDGEAIHDWRHLQRIKNEILGVEREAVEVYPAESRLVDTANVFYLWAFPAGKALDLGFSQRSVRETPRFRNVSQRPFEVKPDDLTNGADEQ